MSTVVFCCWYHSYGASVLLYFTLMSTNNDVNDEVENVKSLRTTTDDGRRRRTDGRTARYDNSSLEPSAQAKFR